LSGRPVPLSIGLKSLHPFAEKPTKFDSFSRGVILLSIGSIGNLPLPFTSTPTRVDGRTEGRTGVPDPSPLSYLTSGDRDLISAMFGPDALNNGSDGSGKPVAIPAFVVILIVDRRSGLLPAGVEVTRTYLRSMWDHFANSTGSVGNPLTRKNLTDGLEFLGRRSHGSLVDLRV
jgi:hypothetical protein